jgi:hypothetical protein
MSQTMPEKIRLRNDNFCPRQNIITPRHCLEVVTACLDSSHGFAPRFYSDEILRLSKRDRTADELGEVESSAASQLVALCWC